MALLGTQGHLLQADLAGTYELRPWHRKRAAFELIDSQRLRFEDHGLRDNVALLTLLQPRRQQEAHAGRPRQQSASVNGGAAAAYGAAANGTPAGQRNGVGSAAPAVAAAGSGAAAAGSGIAAAGSSGGPPLLFGNTHILFNPKRGDIKVQSAARICNPPAGLRHCIRQ